MGALAAAPDEGRERGISGARRVSSRRIDEFFEHQRTASEHLPDPRPLVVNLTKYLVEILAGVRDLDQITRWIDPKVHAALLRKVVFRSRARQAKGIAPSWPRYRLGETRVDAPADGVVECVTVVHQADRARAVAIRLVGIDGRWRATQISML